MEEEHFEIADSGNFISIQGFKPVTQGWIPTLIKVKAGVFSGTKEVEIFIDFFFDLKSKLTVLYNDLKESLLVKDLESYLQIEIKGDGIGHFLVVTSFRDYPHELQFELQFDQTQIPAMVSQLEKIIAKYS